VINICISTGQYWYIDKNNQIVGKISQLDVLRALEPKYDDLGDMGKLAHTGFSPQFLKTMLKTGSFLGNPPQGHLQQSGWF